MKHKIFAIGLGMMLLSGLLLARAPQVYAEPNATFLVSQLTDVLDANLADNRCDTNLATAGDQCSLRAAIQQANATPGTDTITFAFTNVHKLTRAGIDNTAVNGDLDITDSIIIRGRAPNTTIDGGGLDKVFSVFGSNTAAFENLIIRGGRVTTNNLVSAGVEGTLGALTFSNVALTDNIVNFVEPPGLSGSCCNGVADILCNCLVTFTNSQSLSGGQTAGIVAQRVNITNSLIRNHGRYGIVISSGNSTITRSVIADNLGGVHNNGGTLSIRDSEISDNAGGGYLFEVLYVGHGILNTSPNAVTSIVNSTISGNETVESGGGILNYSTVRLFNTTVANNSTNPACEFFAGLVHCTSGNGGGIKNHGTLELTNTIVADNTDNTSDDGVVSDCSGTLTSNGFNLIEDTTDCTLIGTSTGNLLNVDPRLGALQNNGGPTLTRALLRGSPAIDAGNPGGCRDENDAVLTTDQRSSTRPTDGDGDFEVRCDIGAFEAGPVGIGAISPNKGSSMPGEQQIFDVAWDSPTRWRDLNTVDLRFKRGKEIILWLRFTEGLPTSTFSLLDQDGNVIDSGNAGEAKILKNKFGALDLSQSGFTASGPNDPHVILHYAVKFKKSALGKLKMQMLATDDFANAQGPEPGGTWKVKE